jgi:YgiT-type zinc finger domain-containing protein
MKRSTAPFHVDRNGYHLVVDSVPAWVCGQCGEAYFDEREVDAIQQAIRSLDDHTRMLVIPDGIVRGQRTPRSDVVAGQTHRSAARR